MSISGGLGSTGASGAAGGAGSAAGGAGAGVPWMMLAELGIGGISAAMNKFQLQDDSTIEDVKAHAAERAGQIPILGQLFSGLAQKVAERKWQPIFDNRDIKQEQMGDFQKSIDKMNTMLASQREKLQQVDMFKKSDIGENWALNY